MNKFASLTAITLLLASQFARAEADRSTDLRYCLDLKSNVEIAKCAGEISPGDKGRTFSKEKVEKILEEGKTSAAASADESPSTPPALSGTPGKDLPTGNIENSGK